YDLTRLSRTLIPHHTRKPNANTVELPSFPTRRSSDLTGSTASRSPARWRGRLSSWRSSSRSPCGSTATSASRPAGQKRRTTPSRSEEHTSELQSRFDLVCRLLLEKKKKEYNET